MTTGDRILVLDSGPAIALDQLDYARVLAEQDDLTLALSPVVVNELTRKPGAPGSAVPSGCCAGLGTGSLRDWRRRSSGRRGRS